jgi:hypothetical protein
MNFLLPAWISAAWRALQLFLIAAAALLLLVCALWLKAEHDWASPAHASDSASFSHGTLGLETIPLKYLLVLETVSGPQFSYRAGPHKPFTQAYGFITPPPPPGRKVCEASSNEELRAFLPVGFSVSNYLPNSASPTPLKFAGLTCALCHSSRIHTSTGVDRTIIGAGSISLDLIAWGDGFANAVLDPSLSASKILDAYDALCPGSSSGLSARLEKLLLDAWLSNIRAVLLQNMSQYDLPRSGPALIGPQTIYAGPSRTRPFRSVVRTALNFPAADNFALSKVPAIFDQHLKPQSQYDGSIDDPVVRSLVAAYTSGSTVEALSKPPIEANIRHAARFTLQAGNDPSVPSFSSLFPDSLDRSRAARGFAVYQQHCTHCHGFRPLDGGPWSVQNASRIGKNEPLQQIGTDPYRVLFRYSEILPLGIQIQFPGAGPALAAQRSALENAAAEARSSGAGALAGFWTSAASNLDQSRKRYPAGHPFFIPPGVLHSGNPPGYLNGPIPHAWLRAPFLHNGSVPTMRQLIGLDPRPAAFCRGDNSYDPAAAGIAAPPPSPQGTCNPDLPFLFDTTLKGNSNAGHLYPWANPTPAQREQLTDLLEYLKLL